MTIAELGLITTAIVGVAAAASPALVSWANRKHERVMARSTRLYEQRRNAYRDLAIRLERDRLLIQSSGRHWEEPATGSTADEWTELMANTAIVGSAELQAKLADYHEAEELFFRSTPNPPTRSAKESPEEWEEYRRDWERHDEFRKDALKLIDELEQAMRDELANL